MRFLITIIVSILITTSISSQHKCGTVENEWSRNALQNNVKKLYSQNHSTEMDELRYVPITFHMVANSNGLGTLSEEVVYNQLCVLNQQYDSLDMIFYVKQFSYEIESDLASTTPGDATNLFIIRKDDSSVNIYITQEAGEGIAGYYSPFGDFIVIRKEDINQANGTLVHELGHFFTLRHPHFGWEDEPWNEAQHGTTVTITTVGSSQSQMNQVELVNRNANCSVAADLVCDTPPDYGFGQNITQCVMPYVVYDRNGDQVHPLPELWMGYWFNCNNGFFSDEQKELIKMDYDSPRRSHLRVNYKPDTSLIYQDVTLVSPENFDTINTYNAVLLDWEDVENAEAYLVNISGSANLVFEVNQSEIFLDELEAEKTYTWSVFPIKEIGNCASTPSRFFFTGDEISNINEIEEVENFVISPNPIKNNILSASFTATNSFNSRIEILDAQGKVIYRKNRHFQDRLNRIEIDLVNLPKGILFLNIIGETGIITKKFVNN